MDGVNALTIAGILNPAPTMTDLLNPEPSSVEPEVPSSVGERDRAARDGEDAEYKESEPPEHSGDFDFNDDTSWSWISRTDPRMWRPATLRRSRRLPR
ncbi:hypothetical protein PF005_g22662 [Phytophthora fragariae]|uniref:Uncharacterized protein n=1 Tax=Phytophthora fragariae TaxID=53985 RepID=A0A6A3II35_9STRA|nr:hypothetical protein PF003_g19995 [Phytophthora fragariae]KAE8925661.1 hypothetical protein PF009_g24137 [Phytophthora fragariae]KAE8981647.1 hypothetical protein PF011_g21940 [Phytophthora fragariae]KAE9079726.1 hypothetical protein PF007_g23335 [Phytophthora fragariae]KAE9080971.1 hypothetical protein PF010_g22181 [Phytophthora fragariae]